MRIDSSKYVPVLIRFAEDPDRHESWGRFLELRAAGGRLLTRSRVDPRATLRLSFELMGERFRDVEAHVARAREDADGYHVCELRFAAEEPRVGLGRVLRRLAV